MSKGKGYGDGKDERNTFRREEKKKDVADQNLRKAARNEFQRRSKETRDDGKRKGG